MGSQETEILEQVQAEEPENQETNSEEENEQVNENEEDSEEAPEESEEEEQPEEEESEEDESDEQKADSLYQSLKKAGVLKDNPELRNVLFREKAFSEVFPTVEDAKEAQAVVEVFTKYSQDMTTGNVPAILEALSKVDGAQEAFVENFIPALEKHNRDLYLQTLYPEFKKMLKVAGRNQDKNISIAARNIHYFLFGDSDTEREVKVEKKSEKRDSSLDSEREAFQKEVEDRFNQTVSTTSERRLDNYIRSAFKGSGLSKVLEDSLTHTIKTRVGNELQADNRHMGNMNSLWRQAKSAKFSKDWEDRITAAYLSRAKILVNKHRKAVMAEAKLPGVKLQDKQVKRPTPNNSGGNTTSSQKIDPRKIDLTKVKNPDLAILEGRIK